MPSQTDVSLVDTPKSFSFPRRSLTDRVARDGHHDAVPAREKVQILHMGLSCAHSPFQANRVLNLQSESRRPT